MKMSLLTIASIAAVATIPTYASAGPASAAAEAGCTSCGPQNDGRLAQVTPRAAEGKVTARPRDDTGRGDQRPLVTCCDPALATIDFGSMFGKDSMPGGNFGSNYGITFNPSPAFSAAMNNTSFIANVTGGISSMSYLLLVGDLRTDNTPAGTPPLTSGNLGSLWGSSAFSTMLGGPQYLAIWDSPSANVLGTNWLFNSNSNYGYGQAALGANHMRADGTRYILKLTYLLVYQTPKGWVMRQLECNNAEDRYVGFTINYAQRSAGAPGSGNLQIVTAKAPAGAGEKSMRLGQPMPAPDEMIKRLNGGRR